MNVADFTTWIRDVASRFRLAWERAEARHGGVIGRRASLSDWLQRFVLFAEQERKNQRIVKS